MSQDPFTAQGQDPKQAFKDLKELRKKVGRVTTQEYADLMKQPKKTAEKKAPRKVVRQK